MSAFRLPGSRFARRPGFFLGFVPRVIEGTGQANRIQDFPEFFPAAVLYRRAHERSLFGRAALHHVDQRQGRFTLPQVVAQVLSGVRGIPRIVQHIIDQLKSRPKVHAVAREAALDVRRRLAQDRAELRCRFEELRGLAPDHLEISGLAH